MTIRKDGSLRIALVTDMFLPRRGGIELHLADLAERLIAAGHTVDVLTPTPGPDMPGVRRLALPLLPGAAVTIFPRGLRRALAAAFDAGRYDVVHCHASVFSPAAWGGMWVAQRRGTPAALTFHSMLRISAPLLGAAHRLFGAARWPLAVTAVSTVVAEQARAAAPGREVQVLPNGSDVAWWRRHGRAARGRARRELHLVCAMRLTGKKRPDALLRIVAAARAALPPELRLRLTLAGDGPMRPALERLVQRLDLADVVRMPGWRPRTELRTLYHDADLFVLPTRDESFGIAALEARSAGLPVIARVGSGIVDFVRDGRHGYLCASDDEMAERIASLGREPARLASLAAVCRAEPPWAYDWDTVVARHVAVYHSVLGTPSASVPRRDTAFAFTT